MTAISNIHTLADRELLDEDCAAILNVSSNGLIRCRSWNKPTSSQFLINLVGVGVSSTEK